MKQIIQDILKYGVYGRHSSIAQNEKSATDQVFMCRQYVEDRGGRIVAVYKDEAISGATEHRPEFQRLLDDIRDRKIDVLIAESLSRLCRNQADMHKLYDLLMFKGIKLVTLHEGENISDLDVTFRGYMNEKYLRDLRCMTKRGLWLRVTEGHYSMRPPYGYSDCKEIDPNTNKKVAGVLVRVEEELEIIHRIFEMYDNGMSPHKITKALNNDGIKSKTDGLWAATTIRQILRNTMYIGRPVWNKKSVYKDPETGERVYRPNPKEEWHEYEDESLRAISDNLWLSVQARMQELTEKAKERCPQNHLTGRRRNKYMFSGLVKCGVCGGNYAVTAKERMSCANHKSHKGCTNGKSVIRPILENCVFDLLRDKILTEVNIEKLFKIFREDIYSVCRETDSQNSYFRKKIAKIDKKIDAIMDAIYRGVVTETTQSRLKELEEEKADYESRLLDYPVFHVPDDQVLKDFRSMLADMAGTLDDPEQYSKVMNVVRPLIGEIVIYPDDDGNRAEVHGKIARLLDLRTDEKGAISFRVESDIEHVGYANSPISESIVMITYVPRKYECRLIS